MARRTTADGTLLARVAALDDPVGVLSILVDAEPPQPHETHTTWGEAVRHELARAGDAAARRLAALGDELDALLDPRSRGRGRALFVPLSGGEHVHAELALPLVTAVTIGPRPHVRPLAAALDAGRPAGFACVGRSGVRVVAWSLGQADDVAWHAFAASTAEWRDLRGPSQTNPTLSGESVSQRDLFDRRLAAHRDRFDADVADDLALVASERGWTDVVVAGDPRLAEPFASRLGPALGSAVQVLADDSRLTRRMSAHRVAAALYPRVASSRELAALQLARDASDAAGTGGRGAVGFADVAAALADGRAACLVVDPTIGVAGGAGPDGRLVSVDEADVPVTEPDLVDALVVMAVSTGVPVLTAAGEAAGALARLGHAAAVLRW
jgi:histone H3/H4